MSCQRARTYYVGNGSPWTKQSTLCVCVCCVCVCVRERERERLFMWGGCMHNCWCLVKDIQPLNTKQCHQWAFSFVHWTVDVVIWFLNTTSAAKQQVQQPNSGTQLGLSILFETLNCTMIWLQGTASHTDPQELCESRGGRPGLPSLISLRFLWT